MIQPAPNPDALYDSFDKNLYRITGTEETDSILDMMQSDPSANNSTNVQTSVSDLGSGTATAVVNQSVGSIQSGQTLYNDGNPGYFLGVQNGVALLSIGESTTNYLTWDGSTLTISGTINASTIIGGTIETSASGQRIVISGADNKLYFYDSSQLIVAVGTTSLYAITITPSSVTNNGIDITSSVAGNGINITNSAAVNNRGILITQSNASNNLPAIEANYSGSDYTIRMAPASALGIGIFPTGTTTGKTAITISTAATTVPAIYTTGNVASGNGLVDLENTGAASTLYLSGGTPTGNTGVLLINATNEGDTIGVITAASSANATIGMHLNVTNSGHTTKAYAFRFDGDITVNSAVGGSQNQKIRVLVGTTDYYIPCYTA